LPDTSFCDFIFTRDVVEHRHAIAPVAAMLPWLAWNSVFPSDIVGPRPAFCASSA
jgi:hypothetical protein